jgi:NAD(P)-dependent dehydrogenase (short-subunit alcohol dehydrogenase family)
MSSRAAVGAGPAGGEGRLAGKIAIVTGAGQTPGQNIGNGRATAILFAREGARVALLDRERSSAEETAREIEAAGGDAIVIAGDVGVEEDCMAAVAACVEGFGGLDTSLKCRLAP